MIVRPGSTRPRAILVASGIVVCIAGVLPPYLVAALSTQLSHDLHIDLARIGIAGAAFFGTSALGAHRSGKIVHRFGSRVGLATALCFSITSYVVISAAHSYALLLTGLMVGGIGNATAQPAANLRVVELIGVNNLGFALGIKQAAIPAATLLCGIAASVVADSPRWRIAFWASSVAATCTLILLAARRDADGEPRRTSSAPRDRRPPALPGLIVMAAGGAMAAAASAPLGLFVVPSAIGAGLPTRWAGALVAISSILGIGMRVGLGWSADHSRSKGPAVALSRLLLVGAVGYVLLSLGAEGAIVAGCLVGYGAGWTWPGLLHLLAVRSSRAYAAWSTGLIQTGLSLGAAVGPVMFGIIADHESLRWAWLTSAALSLAASHLIGSHRVRGGG